MSCKFYGILVDKMVYNCSLCQKMYIIYANCGRIMLIQYDKFTFGGRLLETMCMHGRLEQDTPKSDCPAIVCMYT